MRTTLVAAVAIAIAIPALISAEEKDRNGKLEITIEHLLDYVKNSDVVFIRNGKEHTPDKAAEHIARKYRHYRDDIETPEDFIRLAATKSMLSGRRYRVRLPDGTTMDTADWLLEELPDTGRRRRCSRLTARETDGNAQATLHVPDGGMPCRPGTCRLHPAR